MDFNWHDARDIGDSLAWLKCPRRDDAIGHLPLVTRWIVELRCPERRIAVEPALRHRHRNGSTLSLKSTRCPVTSDCVRHDIGAQHQ